jgi:hypothetical protein
MAAALSGGVLLVTESSATAADKGTVSVRQLHLPAGMEPVTSGNVPPPPPLPRSADGVQAQAAAWVGPYTYRNLKSGKCLDILGASKSVGATAVQYTCVAGGLSQMWWVLVNNHGETYETIQLGNAWSGLCLDTWTFAVNWPVKQNTCYQNFPPQQWEHTVNYPNRYRNGQTGYFLEVQGSSLQNFAKIVTWYDTGSKQQTWLKYNT